MFALFIVLAAVLCQSEPDTLMCFRTSGNPMTEVFVWDFPSRSISSPDSDNVLRVSSVWDNDSLYVHAEVSDSCLRAFRTENDDRQLYLDDMFEFLLDCNCDRGTAWIEDDIIYHINILGFKKDDRGTPEGISDASWNGNARYVIALKGTVNDDSDVDEGYSVSVALPWSEIGRIPEPGISLGFNFACGDNDGRGRILFDWCGAFPLRSPDKFGLLVLSE